jgi:hypothetical protein
MDYELGEFTAAATFYLAEIYGHFSKALMGSERPQGLTPLELEQYELAIEEQAYPFEEKAITVHESNLKLIHRGVYNEWIEKSLQKLAVLLPARYDKPETASAAVGSLETYVFEIQGPQPSAPPVSAEEKPPAGAAPEAPPPVQNDESAAADRSAVSAGDPGSPQEAAVHKEKSDREDAVQ